MERLNPAALNMWLFGAAIGYTFGGPVGLAAGLATASGITLFFTMIG